MTINQLLDHSPNFPHLWNSPIFHISGNPVPADRYYSTPYADCVSADFCCNNAIYIYVERINIRDVQILFQFGF